MKQFNKIYLSKKLVKLLEEKGMKQVFDGADFFNSNGKFLDKKGFSPITDCIYFDAVDYDDDSKEVVIGKSTYKIKEVTTIYITKLNKNKLGDTIGDLIVADNINLP